MAGASFSELCDDGVDNDCDGDVDEVEGEVCGDGLDTTVMARWMR